MTVFIASTSSINSDLLQILLVQTITKENITSARRCAKASILQLDDVTLLKHLVQNHGGFSDLKPEEYYD
ncbi:hypothetical protein HID58_046044 [Brassica napus]|uniref:Uncharacterized protein n=2 Tax=Brassica TaxID=3705 RepID=A0A3P6D205_BRAOL|nr:hypothetical protein HID58_046044 [Brassica napus]CAF1892562.1 unnamed protein product [Brassica napus]VDD20990.1 unnamed protein product [Brassica oleracea]